MSDASRTEVDRKQQILEGAFSALVKQGLPNLSYDTIAKEVGLSRQLIRYHYKDTEALMVALCDYVAALYREALISGVIATGGKNRLTFF